MQEPNNLDILKKEIKQYVNDGSYIKDIYRKTIEARNIFNTLFSSNSCVVFDIDDTMISEYDFMLSNDFAWTNEIIEESCTITNFSPIGDVKSFFDYCISKGCYTCILTSRRQMYYDTTLQLISNAGYTGYNQLILRPDSDTGTIQEFKKSQRDLLMANKHDIIVNIGDQYSDLEDIPGQPLPSNAIKLPNPFYYISSNV